MMLSAAMLVLRSAPRGELSGRLLLEGGQSPA